MRKLVSKKKIYLLALLVVTLLGFIIVPTYAKFEKVIETEDIAGIGLNFDIGITNIEEYEVITVPAGGADAFNVKVTNSSDSTLYYGVWYRMVEPTEKSSDVKIARVDGTTATTSGSLASNASISPSIVIINNSDVDITLNIGVASSTTSTADIEYIGGKRLINGVYSINYMNTTNATDYFNSDTYRTYITTASFVDYIDTSNAALDENENSIMWDMSTAQDNSIIAWLVENETTDESNNTYYDLYIGSEDKIYAKSLAKFFNSMSGLVSVSFNNLNTSLTTDMYSMFEKCSGIENLDLSSFDTSNVTVMNSPGGYDYGGMFSLCSSLKYLDISSFDTSNVKLFGNMFRGCNSLLELDVSGFDTSNATDMGKMFMNCSSLTSLDLSNFDTSKVTNMGMMFYWSANLVAIDVSTWNTSSVTSFALMFLGCQKLVDLDVSNWNTSNVTDMSSMFNGCSKLITTINVMNTGTTSYSGMFSSAATATGSSITVYYVGDNPNTTDVNESTESLVESILADYSTNSNIMNGGCVGDYCPVVEETTS